MPAKSAKQYRLFQSIVHKKKDSKDNDLNVGPSKEVAEDFIRHTPKDKRRLFAQRKRER